MITSKMANNIRKYNSEYKLLRNVSNPVMILGFPLPLAFIYGIGLFFPVLLAMFLKVFNVNIVVIIALPTSIGLMIVVGVRLFYKEYGINGFFLRRRDKILFSEINGDMSVQEALKEKVSA